MYVSFDDVMCPGWKYSEEISAGEQTIDGYMELHDSSIYNEEDPSTKNGADGKVGARLVLRFSICP